MNVVIDLEACQGHGRCYALAPDVFGADDEGYVELLSAGGQIDPAHEKQARSAVANCPERAITLG